MIECGDSAGEHAGGCLCGAVRYRVAGPPESVNLCYCRQCQKQSGAPMPGFATFRADRLNLLAGTPATFRASDTATRSFCGRCGSALFWQRDGSDQIDLALGSFDRPAELPPPSFQIWTRHRPAWLADLATLTDYPGAYADGPESPYPASS